MPRSEAWTKMRKSLSNDPRVACIATRCRIHRDAVLGKLFRLWAWADDYAVDEHVAHVNAAWINAFTEQSGFAEAMVAVGWIVITESGTKFINLSEHNWEAARQKALAANRAREYRKRASRKQRDASVTASRDERDLPIPIPLPRPEEDKNRGKNPPETPSCPETAEAAVCRADGSVVMTFPTDGTSKTWPLTEAIVADLAEAYPSLDILAECRRALAWVQSAPRHRKTAAGMRRFLTNWMSRTQNRGAVRRPAVAASGETVEDRLGKLFGQEGKT